MILFHTTGCEHGDIRLTESTLTLMKGRVEICINGQWSSVCDNQWDVNDAWVVCQQLGSDGGIYLLRLVPIHVGESSFFNHMQWP